MKIDRTTRKYQKLNNNIGYFNNPLSIMDRFNEAEYQQDNRRLE